MIDADVKVAELREATRLANEALKDLRVERRELEKFLEGYQKWVADQLENAVKVEVQHMADTVGQAIDSAEKRVFHRFDTLGDILMGEDKKGRREGTLQDLVRQWMEKQEE